MQLEEPTPAYRGFLRSGAYPTLTQRLRRGGRLAGRLACLVALAAIAAGAGYKLTQRVVTPAARAQGTSVEALPATRHGIGALSSAHAPKSDLPPPPYAANAQAASGGVSVKRAGNRREAKGAPVSSRKKAAEAVIVAAAEPVLAAPAALPEEARSERARTERIAQRVRALDEAADVEPHVEAAVPAPIPAPAVKRSAQLQSHAAPAIAPAAPAASGAALPLRAAARIVELDVRGSLAASNVRHGLERVQPALAGCYGQAAQQAQRNAFGQVQLRFTIDESGRARAPKVGDVPLPGLEDCLRSAIGKLVCKAPDTGTVQASLLLSFAP